MKFDPSRLSVVALALLASAVDPSAQQGGEAPPRGAERASDPTDPESGRCETITRLMRAVESDLAEIDRLLAEARAAEASSSGTGAALGGFLTSARRRGGNAIQAIDEALRHAHDSGGT